MLRLWHRISRHDPKMEQIEREFTKHSMDRLNLHITTDETSLALTRMLRGLNLSPSSDGEDKKVWKLDQESMSVQMPDQFERYMTDIALIFSIEATKPNAIRPRVDWILVSLTAIVRKKKDEVYSDWSPPSHHVYEAPYWHFKTTVATGSDDQAIETSVDHVLWYGARGDWDTNLVVVRSSSLLDGECWAALPSMSIVHAARKAKKAKGGVYGICTDSYIWTFLHLSDNGHVSKRCLSWADNKQEVIRQLYKIIGQAFDLHRVREEDAEARQRMRDESFGRWDEDESSDDERCDSDEHPWLW